MPIITMDTNNIQIPESGSVQQYTGVKLVRVAVYADGVNTPSINIDTTTELINMVKTDDDEFVVGNSKRIHLSNKHAFIAQACEANADFATYVSTYGKCPNNMISMLFRDAVVTLESTFYKEGDNVPVFNSEDTIEAEHDFFQWRIKEITFSAKIQNFLDGFVEKVLEQQMQTLFK